VNDTYGHDAGDLVLRKFSEVLRGTTRASDICGRMGGEEFVMVMTHVERKDIVPTIDRLREQFASMIFRFGTNTASVTSSFGLAGFDAKGCHEFSQLLRRARFGPLCRQTRRTKSYRARPRLTPEQIQAFWRIFLQKAGWFDSGHCSSIVERGAPCFFCYS